MRVLLRKLLSITPFLCLAACATSDYSVLRDQAYASYEEEAYGLACSQLLELAADVPKDAELWFKAGNACAKAEFPAKAVEAYQNAVIRDPEMAKAWHNLGTVQLQIALATFLEMDSHVPAGDPVLSKAQQLRDGIAVLLKQAN